MRLRGLSRTFGGVAALRGVNLDVAEGEFFTIVGPSGSGKSTLIRLIVGMDSASAGQIMLRGAPIDDMPANARPMCMVFQSLALFPHMSVGQNIAFPLKIRKDPPATRDARVKELLDLVRLPHAAMGKRIAECSGGEQQRVALARALAFDPDILFFDEPLAALDYRLRKTLERELKDLQTRTGKTFIYITHSLEEAMLLSDRIAVMKDGQIVQTGTPDDIYSAPNSRFVAAFMGEVNLFAVTAGADGALTGAGLRAAHGVQQTALPQAETGLLMVRPEHLCFAQDGETFDYALEGVITAAHMLGSRMQYQIAGPGGTVLTVEHLGGRRLPDAVGRPVTLGFDAARAHLIREP